MRRTVHVRNRVRHQRPFFTSHAQTSTTSSAALAWQRLDRGCWFVNCKGTLGGFDLRDKLLDLSRKNTAVRPSGEVGARQRRACRRRRLSKNGVNVPLRNDAVMGEGDAVHRLGASAECCANVDIQDSARTTSKAVRGYSSESLRLCQAQRVVT